MMAWLGRCMTVLLNRPSIAMHLVTMPRALQAEQFSPAGAFYHWTHIAVQPKPVQQPHPPIWVAAATSPETFEWAGKHGFHLMVAPLLAPQLDELKEKIALYRQAYALAK